MKNNLNKLFLLLNSEKVQVRLKKFNLLISLISFIYIYQLINNNLIDSSFEFNLNFIDLTVLIITYLFVGITWVKFSSKDNKKIYKDIFFDWSYSNIGKYVPGGIGVISIRLNQGDSSKNSKKIFFGLLEEQFLVPFLSLPVLVTCLYFVNGNNLIYFLIILQIIFVFLVKLIYFKNESLKNNSLLNYSNYLLVSILLTNFLTILIFYNLGFDDYLYQGLYYLIASYSALLFVGVPSGIGIREGIFLLLADVNFSLSDQIEALIYIRLLYLIADLLFGLSGMIYKYKSS
tara:strand:+ start:3534 stop:4400 length:867 start_codon:yes stop_codon:yes gene_type:complete